MTFDEQAATLDRKQVAELLASREAQSTEIAELRRQLEWFKQQMFGSKSERRLLDPDGRQLSLGEWKQEDAPGAGITIAEHHRHSRKPPKTEPDVSDHALSHGLEIGLNRGHNWPVA